MMSDVIDLYGGSVEVYFIPKNQKATPLSQLFFRDNSTSPFDSQSVSFIHSLNVKTSVLGFTEIEVTFTPPFDQAVNMIKSGMLGLGFAASEPTGQSGPVTDPLVLIRSQ
jgi:hypothetical protein